MRDITANADLLTALRNTSDRGILLIVALTIALSEIAADLCRFVVLVGTLPAAGLFEVRLLSAEHTINMNRREFLERVIAVK